MQQQSLIQQPQPQQQQQPVLSLSMQLSQPSAISSGVLTAAQTQYLTQLSRQSSENLKATGQTFSSSMSNQVLQYLFSFLATTVQIGPRSLLSFNAYLRCARRLYADKRDLNRRTVNIERFLLAKYSRWLATPSKSRKERINFFLDSRLGYRTRDLWKTDRCVIHHTTLALTTRLYIKWRERERRGEGA